MPWALGKHRLTQAYAWFLARWAKRLCWKEVRGLSAPLGRASFARWRWLSNGGVPTRISVTYGPSAIDESCSGKKVIKYLTLVYQIDAHCKRLLWIGQERKVKTLLRLLPLVRHRAQPRAEVHLLGYVEAVSEGHRQEGRAGRACARPLPHHGAFQQGASMRCAPKRSRR